MHTFFADFSLRKVQTEQLRFYYENPLLMFHTLGKEKLGQLSCYRGDDQQR